MVIFLRLKLPILKLPDPDDQPTTPQQDADSSGVYFGLLLGAALGGCLAAFPTMSDVRGILGVLLAFFVIPVTYVVVLGCGTLFVLTLAYTIVGLERLSNCVCKLALRIIKPRR